MIWKNFQVILILFNYFEVQFIRKWLKDKMNKEELDVLLESYQKDSDCYASDIVGLENYSEEEICDIVNDFCEDIADEYELSAECIVGEFIYGSRKRGTARENDDLNVDVYYVGDVDEKEFRRLVNDDTDNARLRLENITVDINPKKVSADEETRNKQIAEWQRFVNEYDKEILSLL